VESPTEKEMADLIIKENSGAIKGLQLLGFRSHTLARVTDALRSIRQCLNARLSDPVKGLFFGGKVGMVDMEHILCKVGRKQGRRDSKSVV